MVEAEQHQILEDVTQTLMEGAKSIHRTKIFFLSGFLNHHTRVLRDTSQGLKRFSFFNKMMFILCCVLAVFSSDEAEFPFLLTLSRQVWRLDLASSHLETMTS